jgi:two-component system sensor kinase FixL
MAAMVDRAAEQITRAAQIILRLREFVRKGEATQLAEDVVKVVAEASALALIGAKERGVKVRLRAAPQLPPVLIDKIQIQQVLVNLMRNAVEAMEASERRELTVACDNDGDGRVAIRVIDTGPGIDPAIADRLFQPFTTTKAQGMGIGLSICRSIIEGHGGTLSAEPRPEGGTVFHFTVPTAK